MPLIIGEDRLIPGFEDDLVGLTVGDTKGFDITFPDDYGEESLAGQQAHFEVELRELREKILPDADDDFARSMGDFDGPREPPRRRSRSASSATPSTRPATSSPTRSSSTRSRTPRSTCPTSSSSRRSR